MAAKRYYTDQTALARQAARVAAHRIALSRRAGIANAQIEAIQRDRAALLVTGAESEVDLQHLAERRADLMADRVADVLDADELNALIEPLQGRALRGDLAPMKARARCRLWWLRQLRRAATRARESEAIRAGRVHRYCTDETVRRRAKSLERALEMMQATELVSDDGETITLKAAFDASTSNKAIRRGELMTRIRGCEEWAEAAGMVGLFTTNTAPSRFHSSGGTNPRYDGSTPRDAQDWLCSTWAKCRAKLAREGVEFMGFRVAEPHKDGCTHWHMLLWCAADKVDQLKAIMHRWWRMGPDGDEAGAAKYRVKIKTMHAGGAAGYVAKYIAKNIDDAGSVADEGHFDDYGDDPGMRQRDLYGGTAAHVDAWASAWGIRQFQPLGQPPVSVWRELRRVTDDAVAGASLRVQHAHEGVQRKGEQRASWFQFLQAQGGPMRGRLYKLRVARLKVEHVGRYETIEVAKPVGVFDVEQPELVPSVRKTWTPRGNRSPRSSEVRSAATAQRAERGAKARAVVPPWTRVNNCTKFARADGSIGVGNFRDVVAALVERVAMNRIGAPPTCQH